MSVVTVTLEARSYDVVVESGLLSSCGTRLAELAKVGRLIVVTDANVAPLHLPALTSAATSAGLCVEAIVLPSGESTKSWSQLEALTDRLLASEIERGEPVVALGGGVVGDLVGFAAAIVKRGCPVVQIPTTLLSQVDSSVGGKTAINTRVGKNLIGAFHQPALVLIDPDTLATLPTREIRAGYAEVVKYGLIDDPEFFAWCETNAGALIEGDVDARLYAITKSVSAKARIVELDERESTGVRALLNLGHTFGHALEAETGYSVRLLHGEAVAAGTALAFRFSAARGLCSPEDAERVVEHLGALGLPTGPLPATDAGGTTLVSHMAHDKKRRDGKIPFVLARGIGRAYVDHSIMLADVASFIDTVR